MKLLAATFILVIWVTATMSKPWRGIVPLHSTRSDVERVLGKPRSTSPYWATYQTDNEAISVHYSTGRSCSAGSNIEWRVPEGRVLSITVAPKALILFSDLHLDESKFQKRTDPHRLNAIEYLSLKEGESITIVNGEVSTFEYFATAADAHLRCPNAPLQKKPEAISSYQLDSYRNLRPKDEDIRLDNFAIALEQDPDAQGHVFVYSGRDVSERSARRRLKRAKAYLVRNRKIKPNRILISYGGERSEFTVELYVVPKGAIPPTPFSLK